MHRHLSQTIFACANIDQRLRAGLVGHWLAGIPNGARALDMSGYNRNGTFASVPVWTAGPFSRGIGLKFDGTDDYVDLGAQPNLILPKISVATWAYWEETPPASWNGLVSNTDTSWGNGWGLYCSSSNYSFFVESYTTNQVPATFPGIKQWFHICGTWDAATLRIYINGRLINSVAYSGSMTGTSAVMNIGRLPTFDAYNMTGTLSDVRVYNRALSGSEVQLLASAQGRIARPSSRRRYGTVSSANPRGGDMFFAIH